MVTWGPPCGQASVKTLTQQMELLPHNVGMCLSYVVSMDIGHHYHVLFPIRRRVLISHGSTIPCISTEVWDSGTLLEEEMMMMMMMMMITTISSCNLEADFRFYYL